MANLKAAQFVRVNTPEAFKANEAEITSSGKIAFLDYEKAEKKDLVNGNSVIYANGKYWNGAVSDKVMTHADITIEGGPLAAQAKEVYGSKIPAGESLQEILSKLLCVEKWGEYNHEDASISISEPSMAGKINLTGKVQNQLGKTYAKVGESFDLASITLDSVSLTTNPNKITFTGNKGYSVANDNTVDGTSKSESTTGEFNGNYTLTLTKSGFGGSEMPVVPESANASEVVSGKVTGLIANLGNNTITAKMTTPSATGSCAEIPQLYIVSNLGNTSEEHKSEVVPAKPNLTAESKFDTASKTIVGVYPVITNGIETTEDDAAGKNNARNTNPVEKEMDTLFDGEHTFYFLMPDATEHPWVFKFDKKQGGTPSIVSVNSWNSAATAWNGEPKFTSSDTGDQVVFTCKEGGANGLKITLKQ